jgi:hypothetical protein
LLWWVDRQGLWLPEIQDVATQMQQEGSWDKPRQGDEGNYYSTAREDRSDIGRDVSKITYLDDQTPISHNKPLTPNLDVRKVKNEQNIEWAKYAVEASVIVGSILLAFAIDAWWEERSERRLEKELLVNMLDGIRATDAGILAAYERMETDNENLRSLLNATDDELSSMPRESLGPMTAALVRANTFDASAMLRTTDIRMIRDSRVRDSLNEWLSTATELSQYNQQAESLSSKALLATARHRVIRQFHMNGIESLDAKIDFVALRGDAELMANVSAMKATQRVIRSIFLPNLQKRNKELEQLLVGVTELNK